MSALAANEVSTTRQDMFRWTLCALVVLLAHGLAALALIARDEDANFDAGSPVALIELAPIPAAPSGTPLDLSPGPRVPESEQRDRVEVSEKPRLDEQKIQGAAQKPDKAVAPPEPEKTPEQDAERQAPSDASTAAAPPVAEETAVQLAAPDAGQAIHAPSASTLRWQRSLVAQLERFKRYPRDAAGQSGVARLAFRIDRQGQVLETRILRSSGSAILDAETLALVRRSEPFPAPPKGVADDQLSFVVPIRYASSFRR